MFAGKHAEKNFPRQPHRMRLTLLRNSLTATTARSLVMTATAAAAASTKFVIAIDGAASTSQLSSKEFLLSQPSGAYTTARTCSDMRRVFEWTTHVDRTAASASAMLKGDDAPASTATTTAPSVQALLDELAQPERLRPRLEATVSAAKRQYIDAFGAEGELKLTLLVSWPEPSSLDADACAAAAGRGGAAGAPPLGSIACHVAPLPALPAPPVRVEVRGAPRANALAKDSAWVAERAPLEALMRSDINELLLASDAGELLEGSQTNFYAIVDGAVHTAGEGILAGTVRRLLLEVCEREGIPVVLSPPTLQSAGTWEGALISSTSRLLLPIDKLYKPHEGKPSEEADLLREFDNGADTLASRLRALVLSEVEAHSSEVG